MKRKALIQWRGGLKRGKGSISTESGALQNVGYSYGQRFEDAPGTNPEELIGAAYASCFSMALAGELEKRGHMTERLDVTSEVHIEKTSAGWKIPQIHLRIVASIPSARAKEIDEIASLTKDNCPIGRVLNTHISMEIHIPSNESVAPDSLI
ncbi:OsmC family peroxiredoxin [Bdellovibrio sp. qaytius]|nr:OsmC family peroxiredoxin [Bdellovibrio sp. qaytius]